MNKQLLSLAACAGLLAVPMSGAAVPVEYVRICSIYGARFHYIPGTDVCRDETNGDTRVQTEGGTWRSLTPYPEGRWVSSPQADCTGGRILKVGTFDAGDFTANAWNRKQTQPVPIALRRGEFVARVMMSGGFFDPRIPNRHAVNTWDGLCVRSVDSIVENSPSGPMTLPFGNGMLPIGCVSNSRIVNMPAAYSVEATAAFPAIDSQYLDGSQSAVAGPYTYGSKLVVTTDFGNSSFQQLTYYDARTDSTQPLAGNVTVSVCVQPGSIR